MNKLVYLLGILAFALLPILAQGQTATPTPSIGDVGTTIGSSSAQSVPTKNITGTGYILGQAAADAVPAPKANRTERKQTTTYETGEWTFLNNDGDFFGFGVGTVPSGANLDFFDPEQYAVEIGMVYVGESTTAPSGCRQFTYTSGLYSFFVGYCIYEGYGMYVLGTNYDDVLFSMTAFSEGNERMIPAGYFITD